MPRTAAQAEASRSNGARSHGPTTAEGKARSAQNALKHAMRSAGAGLCFMDDLEVYAELHDAVAARVRPRDAAEGMLVARLTAALWRAQRAERLEAEFWCYLPQGVRRDDAKLLIKVVAGEPRGQQSLATIQRYQADAQTAFTRTLKALQLLRKLGAEEAVAPANQNEGAEQPPAQHRTNEPEVAAPHAPTNPRTRRFARTNPSRRRTARTNPSAPARTVASAAGRRPSCAAHPAKPPDPDEPEHGAQRTNEPEIGELARTSPPQPPLRPSSPVVLTPGLIGAR